jgi:Cu2+-exporting ATPase
MGKGVDPIRNTDSEHAEHAMHMSQGMPPKSAAAHMGHDQHAGHSVAMFRDKLWLTLILTLPVVAWSGELQHWLGYTAPSFPGSQYIPAFLGAWGARFACKFLGVADEEIRRGC